MDKKLKLVAELRLKPLEKGQLCPSCAGTGADLAETKAARAKGVIDARAYIRCWPCVGSGLE